MPTRGKVANLGNRNEEQDLFDDDIPLYAFEPLERLDSIRVIQLYQTTGNGVECSIRQISFSDGGYQALSYVWGSEERQFRAIVRTATGQTVGYIPLTSNLWNALHDLRDAQELESKVFWIDQICINQQAEEKNHQVKLMGQIYQNATRVISYAGSAVTSNETEKERVQLLERLVQHYQPTCEVLFKMADLNRAFAKRAHLPVLELPEDIQDDERAERFWEWLAKLAFGEWTMRLWIVQEQLLNSEVVMLYGRQMLCWDSVAILPALFCLRILPEQYVSQFWMEHRRHTLVAPASIAESVFSLWLSQRAMQRTSSPQETRVLFRTTRTLLQNMERFEDLECRDPRDRIYALLAISSDTAELAITPDYSDAMSLSLLFRELSIRLLKTSKDLEALDFACRWDNASDSTRPSWALHIPRSPDFQPITLFNGMAHPRPQFSSTFRPRFNGSVLLLRGRIIDSISVSTPPSYLTRSWFLRSGDESHVRTLSQLLASQTKVLSSMDLNVENLSAMARALIANLNWPSSDRNNGLHSKVEEAAFGLWCLLRDETMELKDLSKKAGIDQSSVILQAEEWIDAIAKFFLNAQQIASFSTADEKNASEEMHRNARIRGRSLCFTGGKRTCNSMHEVEKGDAVAAFEGAGFLYILRPVGTRYRLIGNAYIDGLMNGEAYDGLNSDEFDYDIELI
jgi:hypothetical protein